MRAAQMTHGKALEVQLWPLGSGHSKSREKHKNWGSQVRVKAACSPVLLKQRQKGPQRSWLSRPAPSKISRFNNRPCLDMQDEKNHKMHRCQHRLDTHVLLHSCKHGYPHAHIYINIQKGRKKKGKGWLADLCYISFAIDTYEHGDHISSCVRKQNYQKFTRCSLYNKQSSTFLFCLFLNSSICIIKIADYIFHLFSFLFIFVLLWLVWERWLIDWWA